MANGMKVAKPVAHQHHAVQFYENEDSLYATVAGFLGQGLVDAQPAVLISTSAHRDAILERVRSLIDVEKAQLVGHLVVLDAHQLLATFMEDGMPDADAFDRSVGRLVGNLVRKCSANTLIRAYGEMVDVLWKDGKEDAAIRLEMLWNRLAHTHGFALLCGYAMGSFYKETQRFEDICEQHAHVMPPGRPSLNVSRVRVQ